MFAQSSPDLRVLHCLESESLGSTMLRRTFSHLSSLCTPSPSPTHFSNRGFNYYIYGCGDKEWRKPLPFSDFNCQSQILRRSLIVVRFVFHFRMTEMVTRKNHLQIGGTPLSSLFVTSSLHLTVCLLSVFKFLTFQTQVLQNLFHGAFLPCKCFLSKKSI